MCLAFLSARVTQIRGRPIYLRVAILRGIRFGLKLSKQVEYTNGVRLRQGERKIAVSLPLGDCVPGRCSVKREIQLDSRHRFYRDAIQCRWFIYPPPYGCNRRVPQ